MSFRCQGRRRRGGHWKWDGWTNYQSSWNRVVTRRRTTESGILCLHKKRKFKGASPTNLAGVTCVVSTIATETQGEKRGRQSRRGRMGAGSAPNQKCLKSGKLEPDLKDGKKGGARGGQTFQRRHYDIKSNKRIGGGNRETRCNRETLFENV